MEVLFAIVATVAAAGILGGVAATIRVYSRLASIEARMAHGDHRMDRQAEKLTAHSARIANAELRIDRLERPRSNGRLRAARQ